MRKILLLALAILFLASSWMASQDAQLKGTKVSAWPFFVYADAMSKANHFMPSGWMGDFGDVKYLDKWATNPKNGKTCIQIKYTAEKKQSAGWAGIYWQSPANNWGNIKGGFDLTGAKQLSLWVRGEKGGELAEFKLGGIAGEYPDSMVGTTGPIELTKDWQQIAIDLDGEDLTYINGGFCIVISSDSNPDGMTFYLDDIQYTTTKLVTPKKK